jgi:hypothetical protein
MPLFSGATENELPPWLVEYYRNVADRAAQFATKPYEKYPKGRIAPIPDSLRQAHRLSTRTQSADPSLNRAENLLKRSEGSFPQNYQQYLNPYTQSVVSRIAHEGNRNFNENILPALEARFVGLGQHGGSRHATLAARAGRDVQSEILAKQNQALASGYQQAGQLFNADQARAIEGARESAALGGLRQGAQLADIAMLGEAGRYQQQQDQSLKDIDYQDFMRQQNYPFELLQRQAAILQGIPAPAQESSYYQTPATPQLNILGQVGNLSGSIYSALRAAR